MSLRAWFRPPRHLIALFLLITTVPSILLMVSGWRLIVSDRALQSRQLGERREQAADLVVAGLDQAIIAAERALSDPAVFPGLTQSTDAVAVVFTRDRIDAFPRGRLLFYPHVVPRPEALPPVFAHAEDLEHRLREVSRAEAEYRRLARSTDAATRAGALIRLAGLRRKRNDVDGALAALADASAVQGVWHSGVPADLLARWGRCDLLARARRPELTREAAALYADLAGARWQIDRSTFDLHVADAERWGGRQGHAAISADAIALATAVRRLWTAWQEQRPSARDSVLVDGRHMTLLWRTESARFTALATGPQFVERQWVGKLAPLLASQRVRVTLQDGHRTAGTSTRRLRVETGLPWTLVVDSTDAAAAGAFTAAQRLWLSGLAMLAVLVATGTYLTVRAVSRELTVARLQTDFVSAVSHEFRTPLTSLRQLTEMLIDRPATPEDRRRAYYEALARQTDRLHRLVESLLDFGRMEAGRAPYCLEPLDAAPFVRATVAQFAGEVAARGFRIDLAVFNGGTVAADREALTNALWNLLDNAVKYSAQSRTVWVEVDTRDGQLLIRVRDRGLGIPREEQQEIFRKFVRGAAAKAENIKGTGIGLAMVEHVVAAHAGTVTLESEAGAGSTFTFRLPLKMGTLNISPEVDTLRKVETT